jgi:hypothetical protein
MKRSVGRSWKIKRNARLPRHSNSLLPNLRMPSPLWACGRPKLSSSSHKASKHSTLSAFGNSRSPLSTPESMVSSLANHFSQLLGSDGNEFSRALECPVTSVRRFLQGGYLFRCRSVFALRVICGFHLHFAQSDNVGPADDTDVFAARGGSQPPAEVLFGVRDSEGLHIVFIQFQMELVKSWHLRQRRKTGEFWLRLAATLGGGATNMTMKNQNGVTVVILKNSGQESGTQLSLGPDGMQIQMTYLIWSSGLL